MKAGRLPGQLVVYLRRFISQSNKESDIAGRPPKRHVALRHAIYDLGGRVFSNVSECTYYWVFGLICPQSPAKHDLGLRHTQPSQVAKSCRPNARDRFGKHHGVSRPSSIVSKILGSLKRVVELPKERDVSVECLLRTEYSKLFSFLQLSDAFRQEPTGAKALNHVAVPGRTRILLSLVIHRFRNHFSPLTP